MAIDSRLARACSSTLFLALLLGSGCARGEFPGSSPAIGSLESDAVSREAAPGSTVSIRFAIEVDSHITGPVYVVLSDEGNQPGWIQVFRDAERIYFHERCEIPDCSEPPAVCGMAFRRVRNLTAAGGTRSTELIWDGMTSFVDPSSGCEERVAAPAGKYSAHFCYSQEALMDGAGDPARAVSGNIAEPTCVDLPFSLNDPQVVLNIR